VLKRWMLAVAVVGACGLATPGLAAPGEARSKAGWPKPTQSVKSDEKLCRYKFSNGEHTVWVCKKEQPCCEWEALNNYVKCGSTFTGCL
jgi:hypothetical protein